MENSRPQSLKNRTEFLFIKDKGRHIHPAPWLVVNFLEKTSGGLRFGMTLPKYVGNAVVRNRLKRWCRENVRSQNGSYNLDVNFVFRKRKKDFYQTLESGEVFTALDKAFSKMSSDHGQNS